MATAIVQLHVEQVPVGLRVANRYTRAYVVLRRADHPIGHFYVPVRDGEVDPGAFAHALYCEVERNRARWLADDYLGPEPAAFTDDATVAICTRERPEDLRRALTAVTRLDPKPLEVLVIDNAPRSDETCRVAIEFRDVRYVREPRRGLDCARNRALHEARGGIVAFCDDDAAPEPAWLGALVRSFDDRRVWCATGLTLSAELETDAQEWFERYNSFSRGFRRRVFEGAYHDGFSVGAIGAGANMAVRRGVLAELGGFDEALDAGTATCSGGDHDMFGRILAAGYNIVYEPAAVSWHRHRRTWPELRDTMRGYGTGVFALATRRVLRDYEPAALHHAIRWFRHHHLPEGWRAWRARPGAMPRDLISAEIAGCLAGPASYFRAERELRTGAAR